MIKINNLSLRFGKRVLFDNVNIEFKNDNCYGVIGANGAGKTTFLKLLSGEIESTSGEIIYPRDTRISILKQNHNEYNDYTENLRFKSKKENLYEKDNRYYINPCYVICVCFLRYKNNKKGR